MVGFNWAYYFKNPVHSDSLFMISTFSGRLSRSVSLGKSFLLALMAIHLGCTAVDTPEGVGKSDPNILLIMADDMGYGDIASHGNPHIKTPRLNALKKSSVVFQHFYVSPVCAPTRASLLTGKYHQRVGVQSVTNGHEVLDPSSVTIAEWLEERGYRNGIFGKWHLGEY